MIGRFILDTLNFYIFSSEATYRPKCPVYLNETFWGNGNLSAPI